MNNKLGFTMKLTESIGGMGTKMTNCCGFSLKHGTIIIGVVQSIISFIFLILSAAYADNPHELQELLSSLSTDVDGSTLITILSVVKCILIITAITSALMCIFSIFLIFGAETNRPLLLVPWLILTPTLISVGVMVVLALLVHVAGFVNFFFTLLILLVGLIIALVAIYLLLAVFNFYKHLKSLNF